MELKHWDFNIIDLHNENHFDVDASLSVLANGVDFLNLRLAKEMPEKSSVLEIGCGVQSLFLENIKSPNRWDGIDVFEVNKLGVKSIATKIASVENIPFADQYFDYMLSNQSIEHWREYGVSPSVGLSEIRRVVRNEGRVFINFPIHLHGDRIFVKGDFEKIDRCFFDAGLEIVKKTAVIDSRRPNYSGWRCCGFPDFYAKSLAKSEDTSYVVEYEARPVVGHVGRMKPNINTDVFKKRQTSFKLHAHHGLVYLAWKLLSRVFGNKRA